ncbi:MAG: TrkA family potassium uptake protein [Faecalibacterium sp.]
MKSFLVIGLGRFGQHLSRRLSELGNEVMAVDIREDKIHTVMNKVTSVEIGDCTDEEVLDSLGVGNYDACFVCVSSNFQSSLVITDLLKEKGAKRVISRAARDVQAKFLRRNGADDVVYPERGYAERLALRCSRNDVFDYIELADNASIYEIAPIPAWIGKTVSEIDFRAKYCCSILAVKKGGVTDALPGADYVFTGEEHLMVFGKDEEMKKLMKIVG